MEGALFNSSVCVCVCLNKEWLVTTITVICHYCTNGNILPGRLILFQTHYRTDDPVKTQWVFLKGMNLVKELA